MRLTIGKASVHRIATLEPATLAPPAIDEEAEDEREAKELRARLVQQAADKIEFYASYLMGIGECSALEQFLAKTATKIANIRNIHGTGADQ